MVHQRTSSIGLGRVSSLRSPPSVSPRSSSPVKASASSIVIPAPRPGISASRLGPPSPTKRLPGPSLQPRKSLTRQSPGGHETTTPSPAPSSRAAESPAPYSNSISPNGPTQQRIPAPLFVPIQSTSELPSPPPPPPPSTFQISSASISPENPLSPQFVVPNHPTVRPLQVNKSMHDTLSLTLLALASARGSRMSRTTC